MLVAESFFIERKLKNDFGAALRYLYTHPFWSLSRDNSIQGVSFLFWSLLRDLSIYVGIFHISNSLCISKICCFQIHFITSYRNIQMAAIMLQSIPSFYAKILEKSLFISATTFKKYIVCKDYCIAHHNEKTWFLPACKYHIVLVGNVQELLKKLDTFCFTYQHVDCLYTVCQISIQWKNYCKEWTSV